MRSFLLASLVVASLELSAQTLEKVTELNRSGKWDEAAGAAQRLLDSGKLDTAAGCEARYHLTYAQTRLGDLDSARKSLSRYDEKCASIGPKSWLTREITTLRAELQSSVSAPLLDDRWPKAEAAAVGMNPSALRDHQQLCEQSGADACLIARRGKLVQEWYSPRYRVPIMAMSSTKSITSVLVGMLVDDGKIKSIDEPVCKWIDQWCEGNKGKVTLRHLLTMTSGLPRMWEEGAGSRLDKNAFVISLPLDTEPGTKWAYSNEGVQLLSPILEKVAGEPLEEYAKRRLFDPLGMRETRLHVDSAGQPWTYADMETSARDFARIGQLMMQRGMWEGRRIISEKWIAESTSPSQKLRPDYGYLWWLYDGGRAFGAQGHLDTNLYVFPGQELVIVRMQSRPVAGAKSYSREAPKVVRRLLDPIPAAK
jgi:CubicO group peptidase (beta-lactamase class C family)